jgi:hypothetical protein
MYPSDIEVWLMLCDSVESVGGKLYILGGGWSSITAANLPALHPRLAIAAMIRVPWTETNKVHTFKVTMEGEDGESIAFGPDESGETSLTAQFNLGRPPTIQEGDSQNVPFAINVDRQVFRAPGTYNLVVAVNDKEKARLPFRVNIASNIRIG